MSKDLRFRGVLVVDMKVIPIHTGTRRINPFFERKNPDFLLQNRFAISIFGFPSDQEGYSITVVSTGMSDLFVKYGNPKAGKLHQYMESI